MAASSGGEDCEDEVFISSADSPVPYFCHMDGKSTSSIISASLTITGHEVKREVTQRCNYDATTLPGMYKVYLQRLI